MIVEVENEYRILRSLGLVSDDAHGCLRSNSYLSTSTKTLKQRSCSASKTTFKNKYGRK